MPGTTPTTPRKTVVVDAEKLSTLQYRAGQGLACCFDRDEEKHRADSLQAALTPAQEETAHFPEARRWERGRGRREAGAIVGGAGLGWKLFGPTGALLGAAGGVFATLVLTRNTAQRGAAQRGAAQRGAAHKQKRRHVLLP